LLCARLVGGLRLTDVEGMQADIARANLQRTERPVEAAYN